MPSTYIVRDGLDLGVKMAMGVPLDANEDVRLRILDMVSSKMWTHYPWAFTRQNITTQSIALVDGTQDYTAPTTMYRLTKGSLLCTTSTPNISRELDVQQELDVNLRTVTPYSIRAVALQAGVNKLRLEAATSISASENWFLEGEFQPHVTKITSLSQALWVPDHYMEVYAKGVACWALRNGGDPRVGAVQTLPDGRRVFTGMLGEFMDGLHDMKAAEDYGGVDGIFPDENLGMGRDDVLLNIFGVA